MKKLNQRKIRWIVKEMEKGERSVYRIAKLHNVTPRWVRELYRRYREAVDRGIVTNNTMIAILQINFFILLPPLFFL